MSWFGIGRLPRSARWGIVGSIAVVLAIRIAGAGWSGGFVPFFPDSSSFLAMAGRGPLQPRFWSDERPVAYPLVLWSLGRNVRLVVAAQTVAYLVTWLLLVHAAWRLLHRRILAVIGVVAIAALAVQSRFALWTTHVLSESLSGSCLVATVVAWWWASARPSQARVIVAVVLTGAFMLVRDGNVLPTLVVLVPLAAVALVLERRGTEPVRRAFVLGVAALCVVALYVVASQDASGRTQYTVHNNVGLRVLRDPDLTAWFEARGMPLDEALQQRAGKDSWADDSAFLQAPDLARYRDWAARRGQLWMVASWVLHPRPWIRELRATLPQVLADDLEDYDAFGVGDHMPTRPLDPIVGSSDQRWTIALSLASFVGLVTAAARRRRRREALFALLLLVGAWVAMYVNLAGDAVEVHRHLIGSVMALAIALVVGPLIALDTLLDRSAEAVTHGES